MVIICMSKTWRHASAPRGARGTGALGRQRRGGPIRSPARAASGGRSSQG